MSVGILGLFGLLCLELDFFVCIFLLLVLLFLQELGHKLLALEGEFLDFVDGDASEQRQHLIVRPVHFEDDGNQDSLGKVDHNDCNDYNSQKRALIALGEVIVEIKENVGNLLTRQPEDVQSIDSDVKKVFLSTLQSIRSRKRDQT